MLTFVFKTCYDCFKRKPKKPSNQLAADNKHGQIEQQRSLKK